MKKLMLLLFLGLAVMSLTACGGGDGRQPVAAQTEPSSEAVSSSAVPERLEHASGTFILTQGGKVIEPYECLLSSDTYEGDGMWRREEASMVPPWEMAEKLPIVRFDATLRFQMSENAELRAVEVFDYGYEHEYYYETEDEFRSLNGEINAGTYYVVVRVEYTGMYIEEEDKYNTSIYLYIFRLIVGDATSEEELRREENI